MATIDTLATILRALNNNGVSNQEDGQVHSIISYLNPYGTMSVAFAYTEANEQAYFKSLDLRNVHYLWNPRDGITAKGMEFIQLAKQKKITKLPWDPFK